MNAGMIECMNENIEDLYSGLEMEINLETGQAKLSNGIVFYCNPMPKNILDIYKAGGLFKYGKIK